MSRSSRSAASRTAATSRFSAVVRCETAYDYWAPSPRPVPSRRRRPARIGGTVLPRLETTPRYHSFGWQLLLWLASVVLFLMLVN